MKDPIADILRKLDIDMAQAVASGSAKGLGNYDEPVKQIRQQIGREIDEILSDPNRYPNCADWELMNADEVVKFVQSKVCKLEG